MAATTLTAVPSAIYAGDTVIFSLGFDDYPASSGWAITFDFRGKEKTAVSFTSTQDSVDSSRHFVSLTPATTAVWVPGDYKGVGRAIKTPQKLTAWTGLISILPDLSQQTDDYDTRSHARRCLDAIELTMEGKATRDVLNTTVAGQSVGRLTPEQLIAFRAYYLAQVQAENPNLGNTKNILAKFNQP